MGSLSALVIGERLRGTYERLAPVELAFPVALTFLDEDDYDWRLESFYLSFDVVISPYRIQLLHLALERATRRLTRPFLLLATGAHTHTDTLVAGGICDAVVDSLDLSSLATFYVLTRRYPERAASLSDSWSIPPVLLDFGVGNIPSIEPRVISPGALVDFVSYLRRDRHGAAADWDGLPLTTAGELAFQYYHREVAKQVRNQGLMLVKPAFGAVDAAPPGPMRDAFMLMPFSNDLTRVYKEIIVPALTAVDVVVRRADDFFTVGHIMTDIWRRMNTAEFVIADLTSRNANVFYELGIAHTLGKPVILLAQSLDDVPFDVRDQRVILYGTRFDEITTLQHGLQQAVYSLRGSVMPA